VAAASAQHVKFSVTAGFYKPTSIKENDKGQTEIDVDVVGLDDGTNPIVAVNTASAIA
jgi:hypothetical protein